MNTNYLAVVDLETSGLNTQTCQITQICTIVLNPRTLRIEPNGIFNSEIQPIWEDEKAVAAGWSPVEQKALDVTRKTKEKLNESPPFKIVWEKYLQFHKKFNPTRSAYKAPIMVGYNIIGFDMPIIERLCQKFGPTYKDRGSLFSPLHRYDVFDMFEGYTENNPNIQGMTLLDCAKWMGIKVDENSLHDALTDVKVTANIFVKLLHLQREVAKQTDFTRAYKDKELLI